MKTVIYEIATNKIINITENDVDFSKLPSDQMVALYHFLNKLKMVE